MPVKGCAGTSERDPLPRPTSLVMICVRRLHLMSALALAVLFGGTGRSRLFAVEESVPAASADGFEGENLTLKAEVEGGEAPFRYLWFKDHVPVAGAVNAELKFEPLTRNDAGTYWVTVFNDSGSTTSAREVITVRPAKPSRLANVSVVGPASDRLIVGFTLGGSGTTEA